MSSLGTMDRKGDQSDDDVLEASNGWIGSKGPPLSSKNPPTFDLPHKPLPGESSSNGLVRQIGLVPTLSLLIEPSVLFNDLGTVIPELFWRRLPGGDYAKALDINARRQVHTYLDTC